MVKQAGVVYCFGSNLAGHHGRGSALHARRHYGAQYGVGVGRTGDAYAIPTKDEQLNVLPLSVIREHVNTFITYAQEHPHLQFQVMAIGCGLAGYHEEQIMPMFVNAPVNCQLPHSWRERIPYVIDWDSK